MNPEAVAKTKMERYGDPKYNNAERHRQTCLDRYGVISYSQTVEYAHKRTKTLYYDGEMFDSMPELAFFVYQRDTGHEVAHEPTTIPYQYKGENHVYVPDFSVDGRLCEIKGGQFFEDGKMINPFDRSLDGYSAAKHKCMLANDVEIITDFKTYIAYATENYGKDFLRRCIIRPELSPDHLEYPNPLTGENVGMAVGKAQWRVLHQEELRLWEENRNMLRRRLIVSCEELYEKPFHEMTDYELLRGMKIAGLVKGYTRFNPKQMIALIEEHGISSVYDPCAGWGERLLTSHMLGIGYLGIDVNEALKPGYESLDAAYGTEEAGQRFAVADAADYVPDSDFDAVFTCPPYFDQEIYTPDGAENLPADEFVAWWKKVAENSLAAHPRIFAYQTNQRTKARLNPALEELGFTKVGQLDLPCEASHFARITKTEHESVEVFVPPTTPSGEASQDADWVDA